MQRQLSFGGRIPWGVGLLLAVTLVPSLLVAFASRHALPLFELAALVPAEVWRGQLWRLLTWPLVQLSPVSLILTCLVFYWLGTDLANEWGSKRFLNVVGGIVVTAAMGTCLVALLDGSLWEMRYLGSFALGTALTVAWGLIFPWREIRIYFFLPIRGHLLAWLSIAVTVVFAIYYGWEAYLPELFAEAAMLGWIYRRQLGVPWPTKRSTYRKAHQRIRPQRTIEDVSYLRLVETNKAEPPPLAPELEEQVRTALGGRPRQDSETSL